MDTEKFFKERKKNHENYFFSQDGKALVAKTKDGEVTLPIRRVIRRTTEELTAAYQEKKEKLALLEEQHDKNIRALLDAQERGEPDDVILGLNRACQISDSALFEEHWVNKRIVPYSGLEIRLVDLEQKRETRKFPTDVYVFEGRRIGLEYEYNLNSEDIAEVEQEGSDVGQARIVLLPTTMVRNRGELETVGPIEFSAKSEKYKEFSTFYPSAISLDGKVYPTVEHYFQAMKFPGNNEYQELIRRSKDAATAKKLGSISDPSRPIRPDWEMVRDDIMRKGLDAKFRQIPELGLLLTETGNRTLTEVSTDIYWGVGKAKSGKNRLGQLLAELRANLQTERSGEAAGTAGAAEAAVAAGTAGAKIPVVTATPSSKPPISSKIRLKSVPKKIITTTGPSVASAAASAVPAQDETGSERRTIINSALRRIGAIPQSEPQSGSQAE